MVVPFFQTDGAAQVLLRPLEKKSRALYRSDLLGDMEDDGYRGAVSNTTGRHRPTTCLETPHHLTLQHIGRHPIPSHKLNTSTGTVIGEHNIPGFNGNAKFFHQTYFILRRTEDGGRLLPGSEAFDAAWNNFSCTITLERSNAHGQLQFTEESIPVDASCYKVYHDILRMDTNDIVLRVLFRSKRVISTNFKGCWFHVAVRPVQTETNTAFHAGYSNKFKIWSQSKKNERIHLPNTESLEPLAKSTMERNRRKESVDKKGSRVKISARAAFWLDTHLSNLMEDFEFDLPIGYADPALSSDGNSERVYQCSSCYATSFRRDKRDDGCIHNVKCPKDACLKLLCSDNIQNIIDSIGKFNHDYNKLSP